MQLEQQVRKDQGAEMGNWLRKSVVGKRAHALRAGRKARSWDELLTLAENQLGISFRGEANENSDNEGSDQELLEMVEADTGAKLELDPEEGTKRKKKHR